MSVAGTVLDDRDVIATADPAGMLGLACSLGSQLLEGFGAAVATEGLPEGDGLRHIVVCGMGGSGIAGDVARALYASRIAVPIVPIRSYGLPEFCGRDTLVVPVSFSGNTEETLAAYAVAMDRGCRVVTVSAGGELAARAAADGVAHVAVPPEVPVPRAAFGYLAAAPLGILDALGVIPPAAADVRAAAAELDALADRHGPERPIADNGSKAIAAWIGDRTPVVWGSDGIAEVAALRWKTELNENAKVPAFSSSLPELDHNEIEGWSARTGEPYALVVLRTAEEHPRVGPRVAATLEAIAGARLDAREVRAEGTTTLAQLGSLAMLGDLTATYLAILRGVDPTPIPVLMRLKERLRG